MINFDIFEIFRSKPENLSVYHFSKLVVCALNIEVLVFNTLVTSAISDLNSAAADENVSHQLSALCILIQTQNLNLFLRFIIFSLLKVFSSVR